MECIIPGANLKVLGKALQALSKIGDELYVEATQDRLSFITLNSSKTVCARFHFCDTFFSCYEVNENDLKNATNERLTCKLHMKVFLPLFKGALEKKLDFFKLEYETDSDFIIFKMKYKCDDIVMVHKLRLMDNETLSIGVATDSGVNNLGASSSFYNQILSTFNLTDDEITFEINSVKIIARNYCPGTPCRPKMLRSQVNLNKSEFLLYDITKETTINFALKPFRTIIHFAETFNLNIEFNFETGGRPLSIILRNPTFEVNFIVASLNPNSDLNSSVATSNSIASIGPMKQKNAAEDLDLDVMELENWDKGSSKDSSFTEEMKRRRDQENAENLDLNVIPASPESPRTKKAKTVFGRCYNATFHETILGEVLAQNSDSE